MAEINYEEQRTGPVESQVISRPIETSQTGDNEIILIVSGDVPARTASGSYGSTIRVDDASMATGSYRIAGMGFRKGEYTETLLECTRINVPFSNNGTIEYVPFNVDRRTVYTNWIYVWTDDCPLIPAGGTLFTGSIRSGSVDPYIAGDGFDYSCSVDGPDASTIFIPYEHPTYRTTDRYNPILGDAMEDATEAAGILIQTANGSRKLYVHDAHRNFGIGATYAGQIPMNPYPDDSKAAKLSSYIAGFLAQAAAVQGEKDLQLLELPSISYKAISASVYVDRYNTSGSSVGEPEPIDQVWKNLQQGNTDVPEMIFFTGQARLKYSGSSTKFWEIAEMGNRVTIPDSGSILFKIEGTNTVRFTNATVYAPFLNTVYRTNEYGAIKEFWNDTKEGV